MSKRGKSEPIKTRQHKRTAKNKIKRIGKALEGAGGTEKGSLENRLKFWERQL